MVSIGRHEIAGRQEFGDCEVNLGGMRKILVSAGEASGDLYASLVVEELRRMYPDAAFFGCTGPRLRAAGLAVVGLVEVIAHIPRIYGDFRKLLAAAEQERPELAILTDSPDFHLRV